MPAVRVDRQAVPAYEEDLRQPWIRCLRTPSLCAGPSSRKVAIFAFVCRYSLRRSARARPRVNSRWVILIDGR